MKQIIVPFIDEIKTEDIVASLELMEQQKLIRRYSDDSRRELIQVLDWWEWQTGLRYKAPSHYQPPKGWQDRVTPREGGKFAKEEKDQDD